MAFFSCSALRKNNLATILTLASSSLDVPDRADVPLARLYSTRCTADPAGLTLFGAICLLDQVTGLITVGNA
jgi:hypothetical protein